MAHLMTKRDALSVAKLLAIHNNDLACTRTSDLQRELDALRRKVEAQLIDDEGTGEDGDEEAEDVGGTAVAPDSAADEEGDAGTGEGGQPQEEGGGEDPVEEEPVISALAVCLLGGVTTNAGRGRFWIDGSSLHFTVGDIEHEDIESIVRHGDGLEISDDHDTWTYFVKRFPKAWVQALPIGVWFRVSE